MRRLLSAGGHGGSAVRPGRRGLFHRPGPALLAGPGRTAPRRSPDRMSVMSRLAGVAGQPIAHSLSPLIHTTWLREAGLDARYEPFGPEDPAGFALLLAEGRAGKLAGLNVTAPFKEQALALADAATITARTCGSANLLTFREGRIEADSTDGEGLMQALAEQAP